MSDKIEKLKELLKIANDGLTREEFLSSFQQVMGQVLSIEIKVLEKVNKAVSDLLSKQDELRNTAEKDLKALKEQIIGDIQNIKDGLILEVERMFEEQRNGMNFIHDKVKRIKEGKDGAPGIPGRDGKDADPEAIIGEVLKLVKFPDYSGQFKALEEEIEALKRMRRLGGGGTNYLGIMQHFVHDETPSGTVNGSNTVFTILSAPNPADSLKVFVNGQRMKGGGVDFTISNKTITFVTAPPTGSIILVDYMK